METTIFSAEFMEKVGFPIFCCIALFWFINTTMKRHNDLLQTINETLRANTEALKTLIEKVK